MPKSLQFKISSALKDIIGRDLITDDFVAVFELVKNSFDAYASRVDINFESIYTHNAKIIIKDNGKGMNYDDLINRWLFLAYSAKRDGTEDTNFDYRENINVHRHFAGAKGIGRFSCDRLGKKLLLETTKKEINALTHILKTDWEKFEVDLKDEFINISVLYESKNKSNYGLIHGTVIEITELRSNWDRSKLLKLKDSLAKLITPSISKSDQPFKIFMNVPDEIEDDKNKDDERSNVNGEIKNFIFEELGLKTSKIFAKISNDGKFLTTELRDGGTLIYKIKENNNFNLLSNINLTLYYLNQSAKLTFARRMGLSSRGYGHVFLYKNGFRIYPFGEPYEDPMKIDVRKSRKIYSYLGTGELIGQIEIFGNNPELKETSSRGDGLIKNETYNQLEEYFFKILERFEKYVVDVQKWGLSIEDELLDTDIKNRITDLIAKISGSDTILDITYPNNFLELLKESQSSSAESIINDLKKIALQSGNEKLISQANQASIILNEIQKAREESEKEAKIEKLKADKATKELVEKESQNLFLRSIKSQEFDEIISFLHHIGISAGIIDNYLSGIYNKLKRGSIVQSSQFLEIISLVIFENKKIQNISKFATKANFKLYTDAIEINLDEYLKEYINNIVKFTTNDGIKIKFLNKNPDPYIGKFRPIEINILIDNLLSNSKKAGATSFDVSLIRSSNKKLLLSFKDNGKGIEQTKFDEIFKYGYTTNKQGSGIGLYHIKEIIERMNAEIKLESEEKIGTKFTIII